MPKWRRDSTFGPGKRVPLDREQRAVFKAKLDLAHRPGRLTSSCVLIALKLVGMLGADGSTRAYRPSRTWRMSTARPWCAAWRGYGNSAS